MKKTIAILAIVAIFTTAASTTFAKDGENRGRSKAQVKASAELKLNGLRLGDDKFVLVGTVTAKTDTHLTIQATGSANVPNIVNNVVTVRINTDTEFEIKDEDASVSALAVGDRVLVRGEVDGAVVTASHVRTIADTGLRETKAKGQKAMGEITAVSDTSVTIKNSLTGESKSVSITPDTEVRINGETKTAADVQIGDRGVVKFKVLVDSVVAKFINLFR